MFLSQLILLSPEYLGVIVVFVGTVAIALPFGRYASRVFRNEPTWLDFMKPFENWIMKVSRIDPSVDMNWKENMRGMLILNAIFFTWAMLVLSTQGLIPLLNPDHIESMNPTTAFNTAVSFMTNTNLQHYSGETGASYFTQLLVFTFLQFVSAGTGIAAMALLFEALSKRQSNTIGNFYVLFIRSCTRILLPVAMVVVFLLIWQGVPSTFKGATVVNTLEGHSEMVARGPVAPMVAIKQVGTNGGGFFGPNSTHPFENPTYLSNLIENMAILFIPMALVFALGFYLKRPKVGYAFFAAMTALFITFAIVSIYFETRPDPILASQGIENTTGNMEGKEVRFGNVAAAFWGVSTTSTSNGSVNSMHDSQSPLSGGVFLLDMMVNAVYGGVGVGVINFFVFVIIAVFIAGLMVGRTPELLGKKIESKEVKIAAIVAIAHPFLILTGTAIASYTAVRNPGLGWLNNPGSRGFSEMLYEFSSAAANNGSGMEGLHDATPFWNILCGVCMMLGRFIPIIGPIAIAGSLASKKYIPESSGTLKVESLAFNVLLLAVIVIVAALAFFPTLALGPLAEYFSGKI